MPITLTTSQQAAARSAACEPVVLLDVVTASAEVFHFASQPCSWSGINYAARLTDTSQLQTGFATDASALSAPKTLSAEFANDDGWFSQWRPDYFRGQPITYREVFLDVPSDAVRTYDFRTMAQAMPNPSRFLITAEDMLGPVRQRLVPANDTILTASLYPNIWVGEAQPLADGLNRNIPWLFGETYCPMYYVDQSSDGSHIYVACVGSAYFPNTGSVVSWFDGGFSELGFGSTIANEGGSTFPWSIRYAVRNSTRWDGSSFSMPVTEIVIHPTIGPGQPIARRFVRLRSNRTEGDTKGSHPDEVLIWMFRDCIGGVNLTPMLIDSDSLLQARSFYVSNSIFMDGALIEQRPFEELLGLWQRDAMTRLVFRDKIYLVPCQSRTATASFHLGNTMDVSFADPSLGAELSRWTLYFKERTNDADYGPGADLGDNRGGSSVRWEPGSGADVVAFSPFIGRPSTALRVARYWAEQAKAGKRVYTVTGAARTIAVEDGDLVTVTDSLVGASNQLCEVVGTTRAAGVYTYKLVETAMSVFSIGLAAPDPLFGFFYQRILYGGGAATVGPTPDVVVTFTSSHQLNRTPTMLKAWDFNLIVSSLVRGSTTNNSQFVVANATSAPYTLNLNVFLGGWDIRVEP